MQNFPQNFGRNMGNIKKKKKKTPTQNCNKLHISVAQGKDKGLLRCFICIIFTVCRPKANSESNQGDYPQLRFPGEEHDSYTASNPLQAPSLGSTGLTEKVR